MPKFSPKPGKRARLKQGLIYFLFRLRMLFGTVFLFEFLPFPGIICQSKTFLYA